MIVNYELQSIRRISSRRVGALNRACHQSPHPTGIGGSLLRHDHEELYPRQPMRKFLFLISHFLIFSFSFMSAQKISYIESTPSWYIVYDENGKRVRSFSTSQGRLVAYSSEFYIIQVGNSWYYTYNPQGKRLYSFSVASTGEILSCSGDTFTSRWGSWIITWRKDGKRLGSRSTSSR